MSMKSVLAEMKRASPHIRRLMSVAQSSWVRIKPGNSLSYSDDHGYDWIDFDLLSVSDALGKIDSITLEKPEKKPISRVGQNIRRERKKKKLTLEALSRKTGILKPNLSRIENGKVTPSLTTIKRIAAALKTTPRKLIRARSQS